jgi:hypothetical protein
VSGLLLQPFCTTAGPDVVREVGPDQAAAAPDELEELTAASNAAVALVKTGKLEEAEAAARDLLVRFPHVHDGWDRLGMVHEVTGGFLLQSVLGDEGSGGRRPVAYPQVTARIGKPIRMKRNKATPANSLGRLVEYRRGKSVSISLRIPCKHAKNSSSSTA